MPAKITYYYEQERFISSSYAIEKSIRQIFNDTVSFAHITLEELQNGQAFDQDTLAFVLPDIIGQTSPYENDINATIQQQEIEFIESGGVSVRICAGAYHAFEKVHYLFGDGTTIENIKENALFQGLATRHHESYEDCMVTPVSAMINGDLLSFGACYGNGPAFKNLPADTKILAHYENGAAAMVKRDIGHGKAFALGIVPQYGTGALITDPDFEAYPIGQGLRGLLTELHKFEAERHLFMTAFIADIARHGLSTGKIQTSDIKTSIDQLPSLAPLK